MQIKMTITTAYDLYKGDLKIFIDVQFAVLIIIHNSQYQNTKRLFSKLIAKSSHLLSCLNHNTHEHIRARINI